MTNNKNEQLLKKLISVALNFDKTFDELMADNEFQNYFANNKIFKNEISVMSKFLWLEIQTLSEKVQKSFIKNTYKTPDGSKIDIEKFNEKFNVNI
jgi:hypothetical protein